MMTFSLRILDLSSSERENTMIAITPSSKRLKMIRNSRFSDRLIPETVIAVRYTMDDMNTRGVNILAIMGAILLVISG